MSLQFACSNMDDVWVVEQIEKSGKKTGENLRQSEKKE